jgi:acetolactate synthase regulatory subunit
MASQVFLHIGLPKTGTTYLQSVLWGSRRELAADGLLLPGAGHREHLWAALELLERPRLERRDPKAPGTLGRLVAEVVRHRGPAVLTHEFMCGASKQQALRLVERLAPAEVHVVITARDTLGMLTAGWAEYVKNGGTKPLAQMRGDRVGGQSEFGWRTWDLAGVLRRWGKHVDPAHVHVLPVPGTGAPRDQHWRNLAQVLGLDPDRYDAPAEPRNPALGVVQVELLRRINGHLTDFRKPLDRGTWIRGYLAEGHLVRQQGERLGADDDQVAECRERADRAVRIIERRGYHVVGDVEALRVPEELPTRPRPDHVSDAELLDAASTLVAGMLADVRRSAREHPLDPTPGPN